MSWRPKGWENHITDWADKFEKDTLPIFHEASDYESEESRVGTIQKMEQLLRDMRKSAIVYENGADAMLRAITTELAGCWSKADQQFVVQRLLDSLEE